MRMMRLKSVWTTNLVAVLLGVGMYSSFILVPQLVQLQESTGFGFGATVTEAGLFLLPATLMMLVVGVSTNVNALAWGARSTFALFYVAMLEEFAWGRGPTALGYSLSWLGFVVFAPVALANVIVDNVRQDRPASRPV
jgi:hypothetical protein